MGKTIVVSLPIFFSRLILVCMFPKLVYGQNQNPAAPECQKSCGGVNISYPFGIGEGCYRDKGFEILCSKKPFLGMSKLEIVNISSTQVWVKGLSTTDCNRSLNTPVFIDLRKGPFTLSTNNKLLAIGCDVWAQIKNVTNQEYRTGCVSLCPHTDVTNEFCSGNGCCQTTIPKGLKAFNLTVSTIDTYTHTWESNSKDCSYAGLQSNDHLDFVPDVSNLQSTIDGVMKITKSTVLDWAIGDQTCKEAKNDSSNYACRDNSYCVESSNGPGYRCNCSHGYKGNPYVPPGCIKDKDKFEKCGANCTNCVKVGGSYRCGCPSSTISNKTLEGDCIPDHPIKKIKKDRLVLVLIGIGLAVGVGVLVVLAVGYWLYKELKRSRRVQLKHRFFKRNGGLLLEQQISSSEGNIEKTKIFVTEELESATDNFNESRILGRGGSGTVYKGMLPDGRIVAIKKSSVVDERQIGQFINELVILSHVNHKTVVKLLGCCLETEVPLLAYEFISNGTLSYHLHHGDHKASLSWEDRLRIAIEVAGALAYLHSSVSIPIFHRDIKSTNILLDENYRAKVSDFGISRSVPYEKTHLTTLVQGTFGYLDPEYLHSGQFTEKSDVYSFGVVLVELLTGQNPISFARGKDEKNLIMHFVSSIKENRVFQTLEPRVLNEGVKEELLAVSKLAKRCVKQVGKKRPTMKEVMVELERVRKSQLEHHALQSLEEPKYRLGDLACVSKIDLENKGTERKRQTGHKRKRRLTNTQSLPVARFHDLKEIHATFGILTHKSVNLVTIT